MFVLTHHHVRMYARTWTCTHRASGPGYGKTTLDTSRVVQFQRNEKDTGSPEAQIALFTCRIQQLTDHLRTNKKDHQCTRGLQIVLGKRKKMLEYLYRQDKYVIHFIFGSFHVSTNVETHVFSRFRIICFKVHELDAFLFF